MSAVLSDALGEKHSPVSASSGGQIFRLLGIGQIEILLVFRKLLLQNPNDETAIVAKTSAVLGSSLCVKSYSHRLFCATELSSMLSLFSVQPFSLSDGHALALYTSVRLSLPW